MLKGIAKNHFSYHTVLVLSVEKSVFLVVLVLFCNIKQEFYRELSNHGFIEEQ
jgi:hypothetical protein